MPKSHYIRKALTPRLLAQIRINKEWIHFAENHHGEVYWNQATGEIAWLAVRSEESNIMILVKDE